MSSAPQRRPRHSLSWPLMLRRIVGESMAPTLMHGRLVLCWRWFVRLKPRDVVVIEHEGMEKIKRILYIRDGKLFAAGDNPAKSKDSRHFGWLATGDVKGKVLLVRQGKRSQSVTRSIA